jgi:hypothetical protein
MNINMIPKEIIYHHIIPFSPCFDLDKNKLRLQKKRIKLFSFIMQEFYLKKKVQKEIKDHIFKTYQGQSQFSFQNEDYFISISFEKGLIDDYICMYFHNVNINYNIVE